MQAYRLTIRPQTAFGTPLVGDTWFGHICWGIAEQYGHDTLAACLCDYTAGRPFLILALLADRRRTRPQKTQKTPVVATRRP